MGKYLLASSEFPQPPILVFVHQLQDKVFGVFADTAVWWEGHLLVDDAISGLEGSQPGTIKGWVADQHFEEQGSQAVVVDHVVVPLMLNDLRCHVFDAATERMGAAVAELCQPEVSYFDMALGVEQDVFGLEVAIHVAERVDVVDAKQDLNEIDPGFSLLHAADSFQQIKQLSPRAVLHDEDVKLLSFNELLCLHHKRVTQQFTDQLLIIQQSWPSLRLLLDELRPIELSCLFASHQKHFAEAPDRQAAANVILFQSSFTSLGLQRSKSNILLNAAPSQVKLVVKRVIPSLITNRQVGSRA